jgi:hypothetical protein
MVTTMAVASTGSAGFRLKPTGRRNLSSRISGCKTLQPIYNREGKQRGEIRLFFQTLLEIPVFIHIFGLLKLNIANTCPYQEVTV